MNMKPMLALLFAASAHGAWPHAFEMDGVREYSELPRALLKKVGMTAEDEGGLIEMNDNQGATFTDIAYHIQNRKSEWVARAAGAQP